MLQKKVLSYIQKHSLIEPGDRILVAFSGGPDSTCLLHLLNQHFKNVAAAYVNHNLRGNESVQEESFVTRFCKERGIPLFVETLGWKKKPANLEETARKKRYRHLAKIAASEGFNKVALAHHQDDQVETFLLRLIRGSGPWGLAAMQPKRGIYIRPLLEGTRNEILQYLKKRKLPSFIDTSNLQLQFLRNRIRHELIPYVEKHFNPAFRKNIARTILWISEQNLALEKLLNALSVQTNQSRLSRKEFLLLDPEIQKLVLRKALLEIDPSFRFSSRTFAALQKVIEKEENLELPGFLMVESTKNSIVFKQKEGPAGYFEVDVPETGSYRFPPGDVTLRFSIVPGAEFEKRTDVAFLDAEKASFPLYIRNWKKGDSFQPLGMRGSKKLSDFFIDNKIPRQQRKRIPLVFKDDDLVWVGGLQIHNKYKVTDRTRQILKIEIKK